MTVNGRGTTHAYLSWITRPCYSAHDQDSEFICLLTVPRWSYFHGKGSTVKLMKSMVFRQVAGNLLSKQIDFLFFLKVKSRIDLALCQSNVIYNWGGVGGEGTQHLNSIKDCRSNCDVMSKDTFSVYCRMRPEAKCCCHVLM